MEKQFEGMKKAIVVGASSGIGKQNRELKEDIELATVETNAVGFTRILQQLCHW